MSGLSFFMVGYGCHVDIHSVLLVHIVSLVQYKIGRDIWTLASMLNINDAKVDIIKEDVSDLSGACGAVLKMYKEQWKGSAADAKRNIIKVLRDKPLRRYDIAEILCTQC